MRLEKEKMKFTVSYGRKVKASKPYEMIELSASEQSDTSIETMENAFARIRNFVDSKIENHKEVKSP